MNSVSLIIPNWNGKEHLEACLSSVQKQRRAPEQTILVDNGSTDGSVEFVAGRFPGVHVICLEKNLGFAAAVNRGIKASTGEFIALLNNDTEIHPEWLERLTAALGEAPEAGSAASKMLDYADRQNLDGAGDMLTPAGVPFTRGYGEPDDGRYDGEKDLFGACAGASLYRRSLFDRIGLFDEEFISYYEDVDFSFRAQLAGYRCRYVPEAICYHKRNATGLRMGNFMMKMLERNLVLYYVKTYPWPLLAAISPLVILAALRRTMRYVAAGNFGPAWSGFTEGLSLVPRMLSKRKHIQSTRTVGVWYMLKFMKWKKWRG